MVTSTSAFRVFRGVLPWGVAIGLLYWLFRHYPLRDVVAASSHVHPGAFLLFLVVYFAYISSTDIWSLHRTLAAHGVKSRTNKVIRLRLASNLAMILNYGVGQGVLAYLIKRSFGDSFFRVSGVLGLIILADLYLLVTLSFVGTLFVGAEVHDLNLAPWIRLLWALITIGVVFVAVALRWPPLGDRLQRLRFGQLFHAFRTSGPAELLQLALRRLPFVAGASTYLWFLAMCFGVDVPFEKVIALLPLTIVVSAIPITPSGLGTAQISSIFLFEEFISGPEIVAGAVTPAEMLLAMSLVFTIGIYLMKLFSGALFLRSALESPGA